MFIYDLFYFIIDLSSFLLPLFFYSVFAVFTLRSNDLFYLFCGSKVPCTLG